MADNTTTQVAAQEEKREVAQTKNKVTDFSLGIFGTSDNFIMAMQMAKALALSTLVPIAYQKNESNCLIAIELSQRLGISPFAVMQNLDIIQGKPSWSAKALIAMINASGKYDYELQYEEKPGKDGKPFSCQCWTERKGRKVTGIIVDMEMAAAEKWIDKNGSKWKTMPQVMLRYRAASFFSRMNCPEITLGLYTSDEIIDGDFKEIRTENIQHEVHQEIAQNANQTEFQPVAAIEEKPEPKTMADVTAGKQEKEAVKAEKKEQATPAFMQTENM